MAIVDEINRIKTNIANAYDKAEEKGAIIPTKPITRLPEEYQEVEYIESTGTQYIATNCLPISNYTIGGKFSISQNINNTQTFWCARGDATTAQTLTTFFINRKIRTDYNSNTSIEVNFEPHYNEIIDLKLERNKFYINNFLYYTHSEAIFNTKNNINIFASYTGNQTSNLGNWAFMKLYNFYVLNENNIKILDFIPCYRKSDNKIGLYDIVNNEFYTNKGTGDFLKGDDVFPTIPDDKNSANLAKTIDTIIKPEGTLEVNFNDTYDVKKYANVKVNVDTGEEEWQPEPDWWDIDKILDEDTEDYSAKWIMLLDDSTPYTKFQYSYGSIMGASKIKMSDNTEYTNIKNEIVHYWDETKDKECRLGYKTRYAILYFKSTILFGTIDFSNFRQCLYMYFKNATITTGNVSYSFPNLLKIQALKFINCVWNTTSLRFNVTSIRKISLDNCDFSSSKNLDSLFSGCRLLSDESINKLYNNLKSGNETYYAYTFNNCSNLKNISLSNTSNVTSFTNTFNNCINLKSEINIDATACTNMENTFNTCYNIPKINLSNTNKVTNFQNTFAGCCKLKTINNGLIDTSSCTSAANIFSVCISLNNIEFTDTSKIKNMENMFGACYSLKTIQNLDLISATNVNRMFSNCYSLKDLEMQNIKISGLDFSTCTGLSHESLLNIRNACYDYSGDATHTIKIGATNLAKLTQEELAEWQNKNWTIS